MKNAKRRPPIEQVYWTGPIGQAAVARHLGRIGWSVPVGHDTGIVLWESLDDAASWQIGISGRPVAVVAIGRADIDTSRLVKLDHPDWHGLTSGRLWLYPDPIVFSHVIWHTYRQDLVSEATTYNIIMPEPLPVGPLPSGNVMLSI